MTLYGLQGATAAALVCSDNMWQRELGLAAEAASAGSSLCADSMGFSGAVTRTAPGGRSRDDSGGTFENEVWVFDNAADGSAELIIVFHSDGHQRTASIYDRRSSRDGILEPEELASYIPIVLVEATGDWYVSGGNPNSNLDIYVDGNVAVIFGGSSKLSSLGYVSTDGKRDYVISVRDTTGSGRPDLEYRRALLPEGVELAMGRTLPGIEQTAIMVNPDDDEPPIMPWFGWPFFGSLSYGLLTNSPTPESLPPIQMNWATGKIEVVGEFVRSRGWDGQWFVYSFDALQSGQSVAADFENPFAFYNLSGSDTRLADLAIRVTYNPPNHRFLRAGRYPEPLTGVQYTWVQSDGASWQRMKFSLLGHHAPSAEFAFDDYRLLTFEYDTLPSFVTASGWDAVNFVVEMDASPVPRGAGEGIYVWDDVGGGDYFFGLTDDRENALAPRGAIEPGHRGEFILQPVEQLLLYYSPVDGQLHMLGAEGGIWNLGDGMEIVYEDGNKDGYFDTWILMRDGLEIERLFHASQHLIHATDSTLAVVKTELAPHAFEVAPPSSPAGWAELRELLTIQAAAFDAPVAELGAMFEGGASGTPLRAAGSLRAFTWLSGSRLSLTADLNSVTGGGTAGRADSVFVVGSNVYTLNDVQGWTREPLEAPALQAAFELPAPPLHGVTANGVLRLANPSNTTWRGPVNLVIASTTVASWPGLELPGRGEIMKRIAWTPSGPGSHEVGLETPDGAIRLGTVDVDVVARDQAGNSPISVPAARPHWLTLAIASAVIAVGLVAAVRSWVR